MRQFERGPGHSPTARREAEDLPWDLSNWPSIQAPSGQQKCHEAGCVFRRPKPPGMLPLEQHFLVSLVIHPVSMGPG
jgi:hypothetical protein